MARAHDFYIGPPWWRHGGLNEHTSRGDVSDTDIDRNATCPHSRAQKHLKARLTGFQPAILCCDKSNHDVAGNFVAQGWPATAGCPELALRLGISRSLLLFGSQSKVNLAFALPLSIEQLAPGLPLQQSLPRGAVVASYTLHWFLTFKRHRSPPLPSSALGPADCSSLAATPFPARRTGLRSTSGPGWGWQACE